jgi:hypothetical protein
MYLAYFPAIAFWALDGFYLWQERLYRNLYDTVRQLQPDKINFSMDTSAFKANTPWADAFFSKTLLWFHGTLVLTIAAVMLFFPFGGR